MAQDEKVLWHGESEFGRYEVVEQTYNGRSARVLFSGKRDAVQSGIPLDGNAEPLFDYNQRFLEIVEGEMPRRLLLIGGAAMTFPTALLKTVPEIEVDVVEIDPLMVSIAEQYFDFVPNERLNIFRGDGRQFLEHNESPYDMILLDAFSQLRIPKSLATIQAARAVYRNLAPSGLFAANIVSPFYGRAATIIRQQVAAYAQIFARAEVYPADVADSGWQAQNLVLVAQKGGLRTVRVRYKPLVVPNLAGSQPLSD